MYIHSIIVYVFLRYLNDFFAQISSSCIDNIYPYNTYRIINNKNRVYIIILYFIRGLEVGYY